MAWRALALIQKGPPKTYLLDQRSYVRWHERFDALVSVEVTVRAPGLAEGYVYVERDGRSQGI